MSHDLQLDLPADLSPGAILEALDRVLDPELDESILQLGFVESIAAESGHLTVAVRLPTYFCAPNFAYLIAQDIRRELLALEDLQKVTVRLRDHFASEAIEAGVNGDRSFRKAFPAEAFENLSPLRDLFLRKGYAKRQEAFLRKLIEAGFSWEEISALRICDVSFQDGSCRVRRRDGQAAPVGPANVAHHYLERRAEIGLDCSPNAPLMTDLCGDPIPPEKLREYFIQVRTVRVALEANGSLCSVLLEARQGRKRKKFPTSIGNEGIQLRGRHHV